MTTAEKLNRKVLLLNQNFEPLAITQAKRALVLLYLKKAELIEADTRVKVYTLRNALLLPSVLRLLRYVKVKRREVPLTKRNIFRRDNYRCQYCGSTSLSLTTDHIIPKSAGGSDSWENLVTACQECNAKKGGRPLKDLSLRLLRPPKKPHALTFLINSLPSLPEDWKPYIFQ